MAANPHDDYESLAKLLYPSIEASGNVYYGQTRKLTIDTLFNKNNFGFESHIESERLADSTADYGFTYSAKYCWKLGPFHGMFDYAPDKDYDVYYAKYKIVLEDSTHLLSLPPLSSGNFPIYERDAKVEYEDLYFNYGRVPDSDTEYWDGRNFYVIKDGNDYFLYIAVKQNHMQDHLPEWCDDGLMIELDPSCTNSHIFRILPSGIEGYYEIKRKDTTEWHNINDSYAQGHIEVKPGEPVAIRSTSDRPIYNFNTCAEFKHIANAEQCKIRLYGPISALSYKGASDTGYTYNYLRLFYECTELVKAPTIAGNVAHKSEYYATFAHCTNLVEVPKLQATTLYTRCYCSMFAECTSLKIAPISSIYATDTNSVYECDSMFYGCTSLEIAPEVLSVGNNKEGTFFQTFLGCTSLKVAPELPATAVGHQCYTAMFYGCTLIDSISVGLIGDCTSPGYTNHDSMHNWLDGVSPTGTFYCTEGSQYRSGSSGIPSGWVRKTYPRPKEQSLPDSSDYIRDTMITSGSDSDSNGRGSVTDKSTAFSMLKSNPFLDGSVQPNTYNEDGSYNQDIWGYKCFNSPVSFRNGIYGEFGNLTSFDSSDITDAYGEPKGGIELACRDDNESRESVLRQYYHEYTESSTVVHKEINFELDARYGDEHNGIAAWANELGHGSVYIAASAGNLMSPYATNGPYITLSSSDDTVTIAADEIYLNGIVYADHIEGVIDNARKLAYTASDVKLEATSTGVNAYSSITPDNEDNTYTLGSSSNRWYKVYANEAEFYSNVNFGNDTDDLIYTVSVSTDSDSNSSTDMLSIVHHDSAANDTEHGPYITLQKEKDSSDQYLSSTTTLISGSTSNNFARVLVSDGTAASNQSTKAELCASKKVGSSNCIASVDVDFYNTNFPIVTIASTNGTSSVKLTADYANGVFVNFNDTTHIQLAETFIEVGMGIAPYTGNTYDLGAEGAEWKTLYANNLGDSNHAIATANISTLSAATANVSGAVSIGGNLSVNGESIALQNLYGTYCGSYSNINDWLYITVNGSDWASTVYPQINLHRENKNDASSYNTDVTIRCSSVNYTNRAEIKASYDNSTTDKYKVSLLTHNNTDEAKLDLTPAKVEISASHNSTTSSITFLPTIIEASGSIAPSEDSLYDLGKSGTPWKNLHAETCKAKHYCFSNNDDAQLFANDSGITLNCRGNLLPDDNYLNFDLGSTGHKWNNVHANKFHGLIPYPDGVNVEPPIGSIFFACVKITSETGTTIYYPGYEIQVGGNVEGIYYGSIKAGSAPMAGSNAVVPWVDVGSLVSNSSSKKYIALSEFRFISNYTYAFGLVIRTA